MGILKECVQNNTIISSAPCRLDMGGTLDISTFHLPLRHQHPCTFNAALDLRTRIQLTACQGEKLMISSRGFDDVAVDLPTASFFHPMGLIIAVAAYFQADGIHIQIDSASPPRSALGGSSSAVVALIWAFYKALAVTGQAMPEKGVVVDLAHALEQSVAGVHCGTQDQLAAAFGGMNAWHWTGDPMSPAYRRQKFSEAQTTGFSDRILVAYQGTPHMSYGNNTNAIWVRDFLNGRNRSHWATIAALSRGFVQAIDRDDFVEAQRLMNQETDIRIGLTPHVLDDMGKSLVAAARAQDCGARFVGAGGGGCIWALGVDGTQINALRPVWEKLLAEFDKAAILDTAVDDIGVQ